MKSLLIPFIAIFGLLMVHLNSCNVPGAHVQSVDTIPIEKFALKFIEENPDFDNNDITRERASEKFKAAFIENVESEHLLDSIPVKFERLYKAKDGNGYMAQFSAWNPPYGFNFRFFDIVMFDFVTKVSEEEMTNLKEDEYYFLKTKFISDLESIDVFQSLLGARTICNTYDWGVTKKSHGKGEIKLGMMYVDTDSIIPYSR